VREHIDSYWTAILTCADCGQEMNRATKVPESKKGMVSLTSAFAGDDCRNGCRSTFSDLNINTKLEWVKETP